jgi:hypothetical protein
VRPASVRANVYGLPRRTSRETTPAVTGLMSMLAAASVAVREAELGVKAMGAQPL